MFRLLCIAALLIGAGGCSELAVQAYAKCPDCGAVYQARWGFPGQFNLHHCRRCGGNRMIVCSKEVSGWDDNRPPDDCYGEKWHN